MSVWCNTSVKPPSPLIISLFISSCLPTVFLSSSHLTFLPKSGVVCRSICSFPCRQVTVRAGNGAGRSLLCYLPNPHNRPSPVTIYSQRGNGGIFLHLTGIFSPFPRRNYGDRGYRRVSRGPFISRPFRPVPATGPPPRYIPKSVSTSRFRTCIYTSYAGHLMASLRVERPRQLK